MDRGGPTGSEIIAGDSLLGRLFFITGANSGIGCETARVLYNAGATVLMAGRSLQRLRAAARSIEEQTLSEERSRGVLHFLELDLSSQQSVRSCVEQFESNLSLYQQSCSSGLIDTLFCNAGICDPPYGLSEDGFETTFAVNHYGHFSLTLRLLRYISRRIIVVSSGGHFRATFTVSDLPTLSPDTYNGLTVYGDTKLANMLFASELNRRLVSSHSPLRSYSLHPGTIVTQIGRNSTRAQRVVETYQSKTIEQGASTGLWGALHALDEDGGKYLRDCGVAEDDWIDSRAKDEGFARELWEHSEEVTGLRFVDCFVLS